MSTILRAYVKLWGRVKIDTGTKHILNYSDSKNTYYNAKNQLLNYSVC